MLIGAVNFPGWMSAMEEDARLSQQQRAGYTITIRWFLGYLKGRHEGATFDMARSFVEEAVARKQPNDWALQQWKDALNWFF